MDLLQDFPDTFLGAFVLLCSPEVVKEGIEVHGILCLFHTFRLLASRNSSKTKHHSKVVGSEWLPRSFKQMEKMVLDHCFPPNALVGQEVCWYLKVGWTCLMRKKRMHINAGCS